MKSLPPLVLVLLFALPVFAKDLVVASDGSGDFLTVQSAIDAAPSGSGARTTILIRRGTYAELLVVPAEKENLTVRGEDRHSTVIAAVNNAKLNPRRRELFSVAAAGFRLEHLTLHNLTPKGGSQAEAIHINADRVVLEACDFVSFQDTLRLDGRVYAHDCRIEGDVDFIWGGGTAVFDHCAIHAIHDGYLVQSRNDAAHAGYVFLDCTITTAPDLTRFVLARIEPGRFPHSHVAFVGCHFGGLLTPAAWKLDSAADSSHLRFEEFGSTDLTGKPLDVSQRLPASRQLPAAEAAKLRDLAAVFGGWAPRAPGR